MRPLGRDAALGCHAGVTERVRPLEPVEREPAHELPRRPGLLVDLDHAPRAHDPQIRAVHSHPLLDVRSLRVDDDHGMARPGMRLRRAAELVGERGA